MSAEHSVQDQEQGKYSVNLLIKVQILITIYVHVYEGMKAIRKLAWQHPLQAMNGRRVVVEETGS